MVANQVQPLKMANAEWRGQLDLILIVLTKSPRFAIQRSTIESQINKTICFNFAYQKACERLR